MVDPSDQTADIFDKLKICENSSQGLPSWLLPLLNEVLAPKPAENRCQNCHNEAIGDLQKKLDSIESKVDNLTQLVASLTETHQNKSQSPYTSDTGSVVRMPFERPAPSGFVEVLQPMETVNEKQQAHSSSEHSSLDMFLKGAQGCPFVPTSRANMTENLPSPIPPQKTPPLPEPVEAPSNDETPFTPTLPTPPSHHAAPEAEDKPEEKKEETEPEKKEEAPATRPAMRSWRNRGPGMSMASMAARYRNSAAHAFSSLPSRPAPSDDISQADEPKKDDDVTPAVLPSPVLAPVSLNPPPVAKAVEENEESDEDESGSDNGSIVEHSSSGESTMASDDEDADEGDGETYKPSQNVLNQVARERQAQGLGIPKMEPAVSDSPTAECGGGIGH